MKSTSKKSNSKDETSYTFDQKCINCGESPVLVCTEMCGPCTFGEADSLWDWVYQDWTGDKKAAKEAFDSIKLISEVMENAGVKMAETLLHFDQDICIRLLNIVKENDPKLYDEIKEFLE